MLGLCGPVLMLLAAGEASSATPPATARTVAVKEDFFSFLV